MAVDRPGSRAAGPCFCPAIGIAIPLDLTRRMDSSTWFCNHRAILHFHDVRYRTG
jgi:hypothetical protein